MTLGAVRVALLGSGLVGATRLSELAGRVRSVSDVDAVARSLPGSAHLVVSVGGDVRVQGSVTGLRRVFHADVNGVPVAGDRADLLASLSGAGVDEQMLAVRVACGMLPSPLSEQSVWSGVRAVPPDCYLHLGSGPARAVRWWSPPEPELRLADGAVAVREALGAAVDRRHPRSGRLAADLSGGMDSTSLCFLADRDGPGLLTFRWSEAEAVNDDALFADESARSLPEAEHLVVPQERLPSIFADPAGVSVDGEYPYLFARTTARARHSAGVLAEHGACSHLAGHGGDELFHALPGYLPGLLRRRPLTALRHLRGYRALHRWPLAPTLAGATRPGPVGSWWQAQADQLTTPVPRRAPALGWGLTPLRAADWVTSQARDATRELLRDTAEHVEPMAPDPGQHQILLALRSSASGYRQLARLYAESGVRLEMPFYDDRVAEAALAVRLHERATPWRYKPLLAEAMRGTVPGGVLGRSTKGEFGEDLRVGLRRNLPAILEVFADSVLAARGLIDTDVLRTRLLSPQADFTTAIALEYLLGCETWLRSVTDSAGSIDAATAAP